METAKIGTLFLVVLIALGGVGASYANWTDQVDIQANVSLGTLDWKIVDIHSMAGDGAVMTRSGSGKSWTVTVTNAYPGWEGTAIIKEKNTGTLPLKFDSFRVTDVVDDGPIRNYLTLKFYEPDGTSVNFAKTIGAMWSHGWHTYGIHIPIAVGSFHDSKIGLKLDGTLPDTLQGKTITFTFEHVAILDM